MLANESIWYYFFKESKGNPTELKIEGFRELASRWHYGEGKIPDNRTLENAVELNRFAINQGLLDTEAFPGIEGEVMLAIYYDDYDFEFTIMPSGIIDFYLEQDGNEISHEKISSLENAKQKLLQIRKELWKSSDYFTSSTTVRGEIDLKVSHLTTLEKSQAFLLSAGSVYLTEKLFAATI